MKILNLDIWTMEKLRQYTEPNKKKIDFDLFGDEFMKSVLSSGKKIDLLVFMETTTSTYLLEIKHGKYYNYFSGVEVLFQDNQISRIFLIINYSNDKKELLYLKNSIETLINDTFTKEVKDTNKIAM